MSDLLIAESDPNTVTCQDHECKRGPKSKFGVHMRMLSPVPLPLARYDHVHCHCLLLFTADMSNLMMAEEIPNAIASQDHELQRGPKLGLVHMWGGSHRFHMTTVTIIT